VDETNAAQAATVTAASRPGPATRRVAAIDCGTNSIRLLVADVDAGRRRLSDLSREMRIVRLGEGVDQTGRLSPAALDRTMAALGEYAAQIRRLAPEAVRMVATSATRDAENSQEFTTRVKEGLGVAPEVVTGDEEARLSFTGATAELTADFSGPYLVADIGGGSTELVLGDAAGVREACSVDIGCVRMTERHLHGDPPSAAEVAAAAADVDAALEVAAGRIFPTRGHPAALTHPTTPGHPAALTHPTTPGHPALVGLAGSVTTIAGIALDLSEYDSSRIHHSRVSVAAVHEICVRLLAMTHAQRAAIGVMHPGRVDVIGGGALILDRLMARFGFHEVLVSEHDILDGIAWSLVTADR
jgi:exopolyphosphatase / guanosine-5'-triphosphate,3'-diphosphate pyrophosphatase